MMCPHVFLFIMHTVAVISLILAISCVSAVPTTVPSIVLVTVDDLGWGNVGYHRDHNNSFVMAETPIIDQLVREGCEIDRHYSFPVCAPARSAIHSGRFPPHVNLDNSGPSFRNPSDPISGFQGISRGFTTISEKLHAAGYYNIHIGKVCTDAI